MSSKTNIKTEKSNELYKLLSPAFLNDNFIEAVILIEAKNDEDFWEKSNILKEKTGINIENFEIDEEINTIYKTIGIGYFKNFNELKNKWEQMKNLDWFFYTDNSLQFDTNYFFSDGKWCI